MNALLELSNLDEFESQIPDGYELSNGKFVEHKMGAKSSLVAGKIGVLLANHCSANALGDIWFSDTTYRCFPKAKRTVRKPDVSFIRRGRFPDDQIPDGDIKIIPDLAVEVVSPNDLVYELEEKIADYLSVRIPLIWVINPNSRSVYVYRPDQPVIRLTDTDELTGEDVIPGFHCRIDSILLPPEPATPTTQTSEPT
jgi:Uma2 family endonuclease